MMSRMKLETRGSSIQQDTFFVSLTFLGRSAQANMAWAPLLWQDNSFQQGMGLGWITPLMGSSILQGTMICERIQKDSSSGECRVEGGSI